MDMFDSKRGYTAGRFALELDDRQPVGIVSSIDGGQFRSDGVPSKVGGRPGMPGGDFVVTQFPGKPKYEDITISVGMAMSPAFWRWVKSTIENQPERRSGALVGYDFNNRERQRRTFMGALISEITFPALDATANREARLSVKISPEQLNHREGDGSPLLQSQALNEMSKQKLWLTNGFTFSIDRFGNERNVQNAKIEAFTVKHNVIVNPIGAEREVRKAPGRVDMPQLQVTFPTTQMDKWVDWYERTVVRGEYDNSTAQLTYFTSDRSSELLRLEFDGMGVTALEIERYEADKQQIARCKATLYVESMRFIPALGTV